jgi:hypothetical protein
MKVKAILIIALSTFFLAANVTYASSPSPAGATVYIISPTDGEVLESPVTVVFGLQGMGVAPAGTDRPDTGHHHLLIDLEEPPATDRPLPADAQHIHFGGGQTETTIDLPPGEHTLQLILGDMSHFPHSPPVMSEKITIVVK